MRTFLLLVVLIAAAVGFWFSRRAPAELVWESTAPQAAFDKARQAGRPLLLCFTIPG